MLFKAFWVNIWLYSMSEQWHAVLTGHCFDSLLFQLSLHCKGIPYNAVKYLALFMVIPGTYDQARGEMLGKHPRNIGMSQIQTLT